VIKAFWRKRNRVAPGPAADSATTPVPAQRASAAPAAADLPAELPAGPTDIFMSIAPFPTTDTAPWVGAVLHLRGPAPTVEELRGRVGAGIAGLPCLNYRLDVTAAPMRWVLAPADPARQVNELALSDGATIDTAIHDLLREPLPADGAPWHLWLVTGYAPDRYALFYRVSHGLQDMTGMSATFETLFAPGVPRERSSGYLPGLAGVTIPAEMVAAAVGQMSNLPAIPVEPWVTTSSSTERTHTWVTIANERLASAGQGRATRNDVYLTALAHAVGGWIRDDVSPEGGVTLPAMIPMNACYPDEIGQPGNRFATSRLELPAAPSSIQERLEQTVAITPPLMSRTGRFLLRRASEAMPLEVMAAIGMKAPGIVVSNFVLRNELRLGDHVVEHVQPVGFCLANAPLMALAVTYRDETTIDFVTDPAVPGAGRVAARWQAAVDELVAGA